MPDLIRRPAHQACRRPCRGRHPSRLGITNRHALLRKQTQDRPQTMTVAKTSYSCSAAARGLRNSSTSCRPQYRSGLSRLGRLSARRSHSSSDDCGESKPPAQERDCGKHGDRRPDEPMTAQPSVGKSVYLKLDAETVRWVLSLRVLKANPDSFQRSAPTARFRVNGPLANMPEFRAAFGCKAGDHIVRPSDKQCRIW